MTSLALILMPVVLTLLFIPTAFFIGRKSPIFFTAYLILFLYTIFTQIAYVFYPDALALQSFGQYYGDSPFIVYWWYIFLSFVAIFLIFAGIWDKKYKPLFKIGVGSEKRLGSIWYISFVVLYELLLTFFLLSNYQALGYSTQWVIKSNIVWFYMFALNGILLLTIYIKMANSVNRAAKLIYASLFTVSILIFLATAIRSGQRIEIASTLLSFLVFFWYLFAKQIFNHKKRIFRGVAILCLAVIVFQGIRNSRGLDEGPGRFIGVLMNPETYSQLFRPEIIIFQDWFVPSLTLVTSIQKGIIIPTTAVYSDASLFVPFISHVSLGEITSRIIDPDGITGYGYYILTEGYNLVGFCGFIFSAVIFVFSFRFYELFFTSTNDELFNNFMYSIIAYSLIDIVRGQNIILLKAIYLYFLPALFFYYLMSGKKILLMYLNHKK